MFSQIISLLPLLLSLVQAIPISHRSASVSKISTSTSDSFTIFGQFARAAYCGADMAWTCGAACEALPGFVPYVTGGDGNDVPHYFAGYWPAQNTAVVVHEGTDPTQFLSLLTDAEVAQTSLSSSLFPGLSSSIQVHEGFGSAQAASATIILTTVQKIFSDHGINTVTLMGHSLGGAISTIDAIYLKLALPQATIKVVLHGSPRVGNQDFANYVDAAGFAEFTRINHAQDPIPTLPFTDWGYHHASGEDHIEASGTWYACAGEDNNSNDCSTGAVPNLLVGNIIDHLGPYNGVWLGTIFCS